jgi:hypothetical protein
VCVKGQSEVGGGRVRVGPEFANTHGPPFRPLTPGYGRRNPTFVGFKRRTTIDEVVAA